MKAVYAYLFLLLILTSFGNIVCINLQPNERIEYINQTYYVIRNQSIVLDNVSVIINNRTVIADNVTVLNRNLTVTNYTVQYNNVSLIINQYEPYYRNVTVELINYTPKYNTKEIELTNYSVNVTQKEISVIDYKVYEKQVSDFNTILSEIKTYALGAVILSGLMAAVYGLQYIKSDEKENKRK